MALTTSQQAYYRSRLGKTLDEPDLELRYARLQSEALVATEVLEERIATMLTAPLAFTIPGDYQEDRKDNVAHLQRMLEVARNESTGGDGPSTLSSVPPVRRWGR